MAKKKQPPIGFGRSPFDEDDAQGSEPPEQPQGPPPRQPQAVPVFVDSLEALQLLAAYNLTPLSPLSSLEHQLLSVIAGLEKRIEELE